jgi:hypothetical protein
VIEAMSAWGMKHASGRIAPEDLDPTQLVWNMRRHLDARRLPAKRLVAQFEFSGLPASAKARRYWWLVLRKPEIDVCIKHPGFDVDVTVAARLRAMILVWMGHRGLAEAQRAGEVAITGSPRAVADLRAVLGLHDRVEPKEFDFSTRPDPFGPVPAAAE